MKKIYNTLAALALLLCAGSAAAQETTDGPRFYVCEGYDSEGYSLADYPDFGFSDDGTQLTLGKDVYDIADIDSITFTKPNYPAVNIVWNGSSATVNIDPRISGVTYTTKGGHVAIKCTNTTEELLYVLSGSSSNGSFYLEGDYKLRMHLNGVSLTNPDSAAVRIRCGKRIEVKMMKDTENTFVDGIGGSQDACFLTKGHLEFKGRGTLNVMGNSKHAICAKEYLQFKSSTGTVNILSAVKDGIHCGKGANAATEQDYDPSNNYFIMNGGTVNITKCGADCVDADDFGSMFINGGTLTMNVSQTDGNGIACDSVFTMTGGEIQCNIGGVVCNGIRFYYRGDFKGGVVNMNVTGNGSKGIRAKRTTKATDTVLKGGYANFDGTNVIMTVDGGTYTQDSSNCYGIYVEREMTQSAGDIHITVTNAEADAIYARSDTQTGGTRTID